MKKVMDGSMSAASETAKGRPKSEEKKQQIYRAATQLFLEKGYDVSMDEVAERAGVSKQTVYSHFNNKEKLFCACVENRCVSYQMTDSFFQRDLSTREMLLEMAHQFNGLLLSDDAIRLKRLLCAQADHNPRLSELFHDSGPARLKASFQDYLDSQVRKGGLRIADTATAARQLLFMIQGDAHLHALLNVPGGPSPEETERYVEACVDTFLRAYGAP